jgi:hypothetical protein
MPRRTTPPPSKTEVAAARSAVALAEDDAATALPLLRNPACSNVSVYFTALSYSHRLVVTLKQWSLPCEARQMVVDPYARSAEPSRIVQAQCRSALQSSSGFDLVDSSSACSGRPLRAGPDPADRSPEGGHQEICPREAHLHTRTRMPTAIKVSSTAHHSASEGDTIARARR